MHQIKLLCNVILSWPHKDIAKSPNHKLAFELLETYTMLLNRIFELSAQCCVFNSKKHLHSTENMR